MCIVLKVDGFYCAACKNLGVGRWGPGNSYGVRIEKSVQIIINREGREIMHLVASVHPFQCGM